MLVCVIAIFGGALWFIIMWSQLFSSWSIFFITILVSLFIFYILILILVILGVLGTDSQAPKENNSNSIPYKRIVTDEDGNWWNDG